MSQQPPSQPRQLRLEIPSTLTTTYANAAMVSQTHSELILDFIQVLPNDPRARVQQRVVMTPSNAKSFLKALETQVKRYEEKHGEISMPPQPISLADQLFGSIRPNDEEGTSSE